MHFAAALGGLSPSSSGGLAGLAETVSTAWAERIGFSSGSRDLWWISRELLSTGAQVLDGKLVEHAATELTGFFSDSRDLWWILRVTVSVAVAFTLPPLHAKWDGHGSGGCGL